MNYTHNRFQESDPLLIRIASLSAQADTLAAAGDESLAADVAFTVEVCETLYRAGFDGLAKVIGTAEHRLHRRMEGGPR